MDNDEHSHYLHADLGSCDGSGGSAGLAQIESSDVISPSAPVEENRHRELGSPHFRALQGYDTSYDTKFHAGAEGRHDRDGVGSA